MFDWIAGFLGFWASVVAQPIRDMVNQALHAVAGFLLGIIHDVQNAFSFWIGIIKWLITQVENIARDIGNWINYLFHTILPWIYGRLEAAFNYAVELWRDAISYAARGLAALEHLAWSWIQYVLKWAYDNIWLPLIKYADAIWRDLLKWGYTAWWWITHPTELATVLLDYLIAAAEAAFWRIAAPVGTFALRLVVANLRRFVGLLETIITAVF